MTEIDILQKTKNKIKEYEDKSFDAKKAGKYQAMIMFLRFANAQRKTIDEDQVDYPELAKGWQKNNKKDTAAAKKYKKDVNDRRNATTAKNKKKKLEKEKAAFLHKTQVDNDIVAKHKEIQPIKIETVNKHDEPTRVANFLRIADVIQGNPEIVNAFDYKKRIMAKANVSQKAVNVFFQPTNELTHDPIGRMMNFETMTDSELYTKIREKDAQIVTIVQGKILQAVEDDAYNENPITISQLIEIAKISGARIKALETKAKGQAPAVNKLPPGTVLFLANIVQNIQNNPAK